MNKYIAPTIKIEEIDAFDIVLASNGGYEVKALKGVDKNDETSAVFDVSLWF